MCSDLLIEKMCCWKCFKDSFSENFCEFTVQEVTVFRVAVFSNEVLGQIHFLGIYELFNIAKSSILGC